MKELKGIFIEKIKRSPTVASFRFRLPETLDFLPGQFLKVIFDEQNKYNRLLNKYLSFSCAPGKDYIEVTKRISDSEFCQRLRALKPEDTVLFKGPIGSCIFKEEYKKIGFLIGGIGITPVISILEYIADKALPTDVCLLYSNKTEDDIAFKKELDAWRNKNKKIKVIYAVTASEPKDKSCIFGRIDKELLIKHLADYKQRVFFIFGPPKMVSGLQELCLDVGCLKDMVYIENFMGY